MHYNLEWVPWFVFGVFCFIAYWIPDPPIPAEDFAKTKLRNALLLIGSAIAFYECYQILEKAL